MKNTMPFVSVLMPVRNAGRFLVPAIESILRQTYPRLELIIVDDGSSDTSWQTIRAYRNKYPKRIKAFRTTKQLNEAGNGAANLGLLHARGRYIARMDADDVAHPQRIEKQVAYLTAHPGTILLGTQATVIDAKGHAVGVKSAPLENGEIYRQYAIVHPMIHPSVMVNRAMLPDPNVLYTCKFGTNDDYYTFFKLLQYGRFANLPEALLKYRIHDKNASLTHMKRHFWTISKIRIEAITKLNYQAPLFVFPLISVQTALVMLLPERALKELFYYARGIKKITVRLPDIPVLPALQKRIKSYAAFLT